MAKKIAETITLVDTRSKMMRSIQVGDQQLRENGANYLFVRMCDGPSTTSVWLDENQVKKLIGRCNKYLRESR